MNKVLSLQNDHLTNHTLAGVKEPYLFSMQIAQLSQRGVVLEETEEKKKGECCSILQ